MRKSTRLYARLLFKLFFDRTRFCGRTEFSFRIRRGGRGRHRIRVTAREGGFTTSISLRRRTSDVATFEQVFADNGYNLRRLQRWGEILDLYASLAREGTPLILDLGANIGLASLYFAKNWPRAQIVAVEPSEQNYRAMRDNLAGIENVLLLHAAVANQDSAVKIVDPDVQAWAIRTEIALPEAADSITALSVQSILRMAPKNCLPFIVKIDIEGFESNLFLKNTGWVELFPLVIIELHDWMLPRQRSAANFLRVIVQQDRDFIPFGEIVVSIANARPAGSHGVHAQTKPDD